MGTTATRLGGLFGLACALVIIPAYLVGSPESPTSGIGAQSYFHNAATFLTANGTLPLLHLLFGLLFIGTLISLLRKAAGPSGAVYIALIGGAVFLALAAAGLAAEVAVPAAAVQFNDMTITTYSQPFLALSFWLYHFSQIGSATLIFATAFIVWRTEALPSWTALLAVLGIAPLLHSWLGFLAACSTEVWFALMGILLLVLPASRPNTATAPAASESVGV